MPLAREFHPHDTIEAAGAIESRTDRPDGRITFVTEWRGQMTYRSNDVISGELHRRFRPPGPHFTPKDIEELLHGMSGW
jgi:hypothetical protein